MKKSQFFFFLKGVNKHYIRKVPELLTHDWFKTKVRQESSFARSIGKGSMGKLHSVSRVFLHVLLYARLGHDDDGHVPKYLAGRQKRKV